MDKTINIEAITYNLNKLNVSIIENNEDEKLIEEYNKYKKAYLELRMFEEFDINICSQALKSFKSHLKNHPYLNGENKDIIIDKINLVDKQLELIAIA